LLEQIWKILAICEVGCQQLCLGREDVQLNLSAWEIIQSAVQPQDDDTEDEALMMQLFLDFITADALKNNTLQPYTIAQSEAAHSLIDGVELDYD
jgi:hypothetical protein